MTDNIFLTEALKINAQMEISKLTAAFDAVPPHNFSEDFEAKMRHILKYHNKTIKRKPRVSRILMKFAACFTAVIILFTVAPTSKASFGNFVLEFFGNYMTVKFNSFISKNEEVEKLSDIEIGYIPEGYQKIDESTTETYIYMKYKNGTNEIEINYLANDNSDSYFNSEGYDVKELTVGQNSAKLFTTPDASKNSAIIVNIFDQYVLVISTNSNAEELVRIAENIKIEK